MPCTQCPEPEPRLDVAAAVYKSATLNDDQLFRSPRGIALDDEGRMFVADFASYRVQVYQKEAIPVSEEQMGPAPTSVALR